MVDEGKLYELELVLKVLDRRYNDKSAIVVSPREELNVAERYSNTQAFFDTL